MLTANKLRSLLLYEPATGEFFWRARRNGVGRDLRAGWKVWNGYIVIGIDGLKYRAHRLAWLYMTGEWPPADIDHKDGDRANNVWTNLRSATRSQNLGNMKRRSDNTSSVKGVCFDHSRQKWLAQIKIGDLRHCKRFDTFEEAVAHYRVMAERGFGEFARAA